MKAGQTSIRNGIQDLLCPFPYFGVTRGANIESHLGTMANDIGYKNISNPYEPYFAPCDVKCVWTLQSHGQAMWQSLNKVRFADGSIDYITFITVHDNSMIAKAGLILKQGELMGHKGKKMATGEHCHIQCAKGLYTVANWKNNRYSIPCFPNEINLDKVFFFDNTELASSKYIPYKLKYLKDILVEEEKEEQSVQNTTKYINLSPSADTWRVYPLNKQPVVGNECGFAYPSRFGGLSYTILRYISNSVVVIKTRDWGEVQIYIAHEKATITDLPKYGLVN